MPLSPTTSPPLQTYTLPLNNIQLAATPPQNTTKELFYIRDTLQNQGIWSYVSFCFFFSFFLKKS